MAFWPQKEPSAERSQVGALAAIMSTRKLSGTFGALLAATVVVVLVDAWLLGQGGRGELAVRGVKGQATIVSLDDPLSGVYYPDSPPLVRYVFAVNGRRYEGVFRVSHVQFRELALGDTIEVAYLPDRPADNAPVSELDPVQSRYFVYLLLSINATILGGWLVVLANAYRSRLCRRHLVHLANDIGRPPKGKV